MPIVDQHLHLETGPHTPDDYPRSWIEAYVETGRSRGIERLGIVEHAYRFLEAKTILDRPWSDERCRYPLERWLERMEAMRASGLPIAIGIEMDYVPGKEEEIARFLERYAWDFVLGSVHFIGDFPLDLSAQDWDGVDPQPIYEAYYETSVRLARTRLFDVLTHPDLPKIFGRRPSQPLDRSYQAVVEALAETGMAIEVNTAGLRKFVCEIYPVPDLLRRARQAGIPATVASDAHEPKYVGQDFERAFSLLRQCGYGEVASFRGRVREETPLPTA